MTPTDKPMTVEALMKNMRLAWYLGQRYSQQADSESYADNKRSDLTRKQFDELLETSLAAIEQYGDQREAAGHAFRKKYIRDLEDSLRTIANIFGVLDENPNVDALIAHLRKIAAGRGSGEPARRWPFVETPGQFAERMREALRDFGGDMLAACRYCLIESPPTIARHQSHEPLTEEQIENLILEKHFRNGYERRTSDGVCLAWYRLGVRDAEIAHNIRSAR